MPVDEAHRREEETEGEHVFRYLRAVVSWVAAVLATAQHEVFRHNTPVEIFHVHIPGEATTELSALQSIRQDILGRYSEDSPVSGRTQAFFDAQQKRRRTLTDSVHAESALLGILTDETKEILLDVHTIFEYRGHAFKDIGSIFPVSRILCPLLRLRRLTQYRHTARPHLHWQYAQLLLLLLISCRALVEED